MRENTNSINKSQSNKNLQYITSPYTIAVCTIIVLGLTVLAYLPGLSGDFLLDDLPNILENDRIKIQSLTFDDLITAAFSSDSGPLRRPISMVTFALNNYFFGISPYSFKVTNLVIHLLNGLLLFVLTFLMLKAYRETSSKKISDVAIISLAITISFTWLLHPINLTAVLYIVQRMTSLATLFMVSALCLYCYARIRMLRNQTGFLLILVPVPICFVLGMLCKENAVLLPLFITALEFVIFRFRDSHGDIDKRLVSLYLISFLIISLGAIVWLSINLSQILNGYDLRDFTLSERLLTEARIVVLYLKWILFPNLHELGLYHDDIAISTGLYDPYTTLLSVLLIFFLCLIAMWFRKRSPLLSLGIAWFFIGHLLESTIYPLELVYEHRNYLPSFCILLALLSLFLTKERAIAVKKYFYVGLVAYIGLLFTVTTFRATQWEDNLSHAQFSVAHHPNSARATFTLGRIYANLNIGGHLDNSDLVITTLERASILDPSGITPEITLILFSKKLESPLKYSWIESIHNKLKNSPVSSADTSALYKFISEPSINNILSHHQIMTMFDRAKNSPGLESTPRIHADLLTIQANYLMNQRNDFQTTRDLMLKARNIDPKEPQYRINLANLALALGETKLAESEIMYLKSIDRFGRSNSDIAILENKLAHIKDELNIEENFSD